MTAEDLLDALAGECSATKFWNELIALEKMGKLLRPVLKLMVCPEKMGAVTGRLQLTSKGLAL